MKKTKTVSITFYNTIVPTKAGLRFVLWKITDATKVNTYDWGFAYWDGKDWEPLEVPVDWSAIVVWWAETLHPDVLLKEKSKIISLNGK